MEAEEFVVFMQELRKERGISIRKLCRGLCSMGVVENMMDGKWKTDRRLQNIMLERLGLVDEDYVYLLNCEDYECWEDRQHILHCITFREIEKAEELLEKYRKRYCMDDRIEEQFYLVIHAQIRRIQGCTREELSAYYEEALKKTVPEAGVVQLSKTALSVKELNLILETEHYRKEGERCARYQEVLDFVEKGKFSRAVRAKIYPKTVYYFSRCAAESSKLMDNAVLLRYCCEAIELLRECERMYYLWELLDLTMKFVHRISEELMQQGQANKAKALEELYQEKEEWKQALEEIYAETGIPKETEDDCYLYVMRGAYCLNDVIRIRRNMLGLNRKELCSGICDVKTLQRLEQGKTRPQSKIVRELLVRLGLPGEYTRIELVTGSPEVYRMMRQLRGEANEWCWEETDALREHIRGMVSMEIPCNRQVVLNKELLSRWRKGEISRETYCKQMLEVLELTLPYHAFLRAGEKYLTNEEQTCIVNRMQGLDSNSEEFHDCMSRLEEYYHLYIETGLWEGVWNMYEFVMSNIGSAWGNIGEYDRADSYNSLILKGCLCFRRMGMVYSSIYDRWWNYDKRKCSGIPVDKELNDEKELSRCILFSHLAKDERRERFYKEKLKIIRDRV